jgi:hypothetical protein
MNIPFALSHLPRDRRGLPIPFIVYRDQEGNPHFTINDSLRLAMVLDRKLCGLCGKPLKLGQMWFVGGAGAAFHERGLYIDPPSHEICGRFAMQVCPFIAAPNYSKRIDDRTLDPAKKHPETYIKQDQTTDPARPPYFVFARAANYRRVEVEPGLVYLQPKRPWKDVEFWERGQRIDQGRATALLAGTEYAPALLKWWPNERERAES